MGVLSALYKPVQGLNYIFLIYAYSLGASIGVVLYVLEVSKEGGISQLNPQVFRSIAITGVVSGNLNPNPNPN